MSPLQHRTLLNLFELLIRVTLITFKNIFKRRFFFEMQLQRDRNCIEFREKGKIK